MIKFWSDLHYELHPYLTITGKICGVFYEFYKEKWPPYIQSTLF